MSKELSTITEQEEGFKLTEAQEEYIKIYHEYFVLKWSWVDLCTYHNCSKMKISKAIRWVIDNKLEIPPDYLVKGAIDSIHERLKLTTALLDAEVSKKRFRDNSFIISLTREIREDENAIYKLQSIVGKEHLDDERLTSAQTLSLIKAAIVQQQDISKSEQEASKELQR